MNNAQRYLEFQFSKELYKKSSNSYIFTFNIVYNEKNLFYSVLFKCCKINNKNELMYNMITCIIKKTHKIKQKSSNYIC